METTHFHIGFDSSLYDLNLNSSRSASDFREFEQQLQQPIIDQAPYFGPPALFGSVPSINLAESQGTVGLTAINDGVSSNRIIAKYPTEDGEGEWSPEAKAPRTNSTLDEQSPTHGQSAGSSRGSLSGNQITPVHSSKHSQIEKYHCSYSSCERSRPGSGFCRRDHLTQHVRRMHKQASIPRLRAKPAAIPSSSNENNLNPLSEPILRPKKRKHIGDGELDANSAKNLAAGLEEELEEERRLRLLAEQEIQQLRQKLEKYEERMERNEERLDKLMNFLEEYKGPGVPKR